MRKDSWKKNRGKPQPPLQQHTKRASLKAHAGGQLLNRRSAAHQCKQPSRSNPPPRQNICFVGSVVCPVVLQKHSAGFRIVGTSRKSRLPVWYHLFPVADVPVRRRPNTGLQVMLWATLLLFTSLQQSGLGMVLCSTKVGRCPRLSCMEAWGYFIFSACFPIWSDKGSRHNVLCGVLSTAASRTTFLNIYPRGTFTFAVVTLSRSLRMTFINGLPQRTACRQFTYISHFRPSFFLKILTGTKAWH